MRANLRAAYGCALSLAGYVAAAPATAWAFSAVGRRCSYATFLTDCDFGARVYDPSAYAALAATTAAAMAYARLKAHARAWYPIAATFGTILLLAAGYDALMRRPVIGVDKIVDDTFNTLRFAIMASMLLVCAMARRVRMSAAGTAAAVVVSNAAAIAVALLFVELSEHVMGATKLYLLFLLYAFGGFGAHIMAVSWLFAHGRMDDDLAVTTLGATA